MLNHFDAEIKLRAVAQTLTNGLYTATVTETAVWADVQSVKRQEFYSALTAGVSADIVFVVNVVDYDGQTEIEYGGKVYKVQRSYQTDIDHIELTCTRG